MRVVTQVAELRSLISSAKRGKDFSTNLFLTDAALEPVVGSGALFVTATTGAVVFAQRESNFDRLYYAASGSAALQDALAQLVPPASGVLVTDLIGKENEVGMLADAFVTAGFSRHSTLVRMQRIASTGAAVHDIPENHVELAAESDAEAVWNAIADAFDQYSDQVPRVSEIRQAAAGGTVLIIRDGVRLAALLYYDRSGLTSVLRYWLVLPAYRRHGLGDKLMQRYILDCDNCRRFLLWVHADNKRAIQLYGLYGYEMDSIIDAVMVRRR